MKASMVSTAALLLSAALYSAASAQEEGQDPVQSEQTTEQLPATSPTLPTAAVRKRDPRTLYFIGPRAQLQRQTGPGIGAPKSILPSPFVPRGSLTLPPPDAMPAQSDTIDPAIPELPAHANGEPPVTENVEPDAQNPLDPFGGALQERALERLDPSGIPVSYGGDVTATVWEGYSRQEVVAFLNVLARPNMSPTLTQLANAVAASRLTVPAPEQDADIIRMIQARLAVFEASANIPAYTALIDALPVDRDWSALALDKARAHLLKGELLAACDVAENQRAIDGDSYWVRLSAFCMAAAGNRVGVDFQLGILEESASLDVTFYQLLDQILIEAEQSSGAVIAEPTQLPGPLNVNVISVAMARLARVAVEDVDVMSSDMLAVAMLIQNPSLSQDARLRLIEVLLSRGVVDGHALAAVAQNMPLAAGEVEALLVSLSTGNALNIDTANEVTGAAYIDASIDVEQGKAVSATLLAAIAQHTDDDISERALMQLWQQYIDAGNAANIAPGLVRLIGGRPNTDVNADTRAVLVRSAALTSMQDFDVHARSLRARAAGEDLAMDAALLRIWPLLAIAEDNDNAETDAASFDIWWQGMADNENRYAIGAALATILEASGRAVPDAIWNTLTAGPSTFPGINVSPVLWRSLQAGAAARDPIVTLRAVYMLLTQVPPKDLPPSIVGVLVASLKQVGFDAAATAIAYDVLISKGL